MKYILYVLYLSMTSVVLFSQEIFLIFSYNVNFELYQWFRGKESAYSAGDAETWVRSLGQEDPLEEKMVNHSCILAWKIPWTEELGRLQYMGLQQVERE